MGNEHATAGYRVVKVKPNSPASTLPIEPMLDFLIYPPFEAAESAPPFNEFITSHEGKEIELTFFNIASQKSWKGKLIPRKWEGEGLLGLTINQEDYATAHTKVLRVLNFFVNSPLHKAGFKSYTDYILGTEHYTFNDMDEFTEFVKHNEKKPIDLFVYNSEQGKVRALTLVPDSHWGGSGYLGGDIGFGHLHSLPIRKDVTGLVPNEPETEALKSEPAATTQSEPPKVEQPKPADAPRTAPVTPQPVEVVKKEEKPIEVLGVDEKDILLGEKKPAEDKKPTEAAGEQKIIQGEIMI